MSAYRGLRVAVAALFIFLGGTASAPGAGDDPGEALIRKVARKYAASKTFSARFRQEIPLQNLGIVRKASGQVYFERPLKMRWDYHGKDAQIFLADGEYLYFRPADSPQVFRRKLDEKSLGGRVPLLLLFGKGEITDLFRVEQAVPRKGGEETALRLAPRGDGAPEVRRIDLVVGNGDFLVREIHIYDRMGGGNHLFLDGTQLDPSLPPRLFRFQRPAGMEVVDG
ncbi:MAG: outer membrane lipoprotein carrier protein LolA [Deltaproteobacteria bacterium]|nr:outer membrane lipoprotein carrier protein LolA [Deltaproteobacteria bacterium]